MICLAFSFSSNLTDQSALLAFRNEITTDPNNILASNWTTKISFCNWVGVSCSRQRQRVRALKLRNMGLQGTISPYVGNLSFLVRLDLRNNSFHGPLTHEIGRLSRMKALILQDNKIQGIIPPTLFHCRMLQNISLWNNRFSGQIPEELGTLSKVQILYLGCNYFTGTIPSSVANLSTLQLLCELTDLSLSYNKLEGSIPRDIGSLRKLEILYLGGNNFEGVDSRIIWRLGRLGIYGSPTTIYQAQFPEYGSEGRVSTRGDIFSYGIMLLETFTKKKPTDEMFTGELTLRHWVNASLLDKLMEVVDCGLLRIENGDMIATQDSLLAIMELGLECCKEIPEERNDIQEVVSKLNKIKLQLIRNRRT
ncbi:hypothetical protein F0562_030534 [Nyssa sinensis]|uniref:Leucine-rich repeat-containing N-terminal plant-type domain-containing protein n=1 Tax=Nyssa sinensis TaxID=561372 RepID=A0A5J5B306_9ASTE|nr:hypothetical protein F0562_030534 [Nyssa sinensis]